MKQLWILVGTTLLVLSGCGRNKDSRAAWCLRLRQTGNAGRWANTAHIADASASRRILMAAEAVVEATSLAKSYGELQVLDQVDFQVRQGEIFLIGADGAGKTTAFKIIASVLAHACIHLQSRPSDRFALRPESSACSSTLR
jgi:ATPase subunit of ABC transporter with duplicated ATPase domains